MLKVPVLTAGLHLSDEVTADPSDHRRRAMGGSREMRIKPCRGTLQLLVKDFGCQECIEFICQVITHRHDHSNGFKVNNSPTVHIHIACVLAACGCFVVGYKPWVLVLLLSVLMDSKDKAVGFLFQRHPDSTLRGWQDFDFQMLNLRRESIQKDPSEKLSIRICAGLNLQIFLEAQKNTNISS